MLKKLLFLVLSALFFVALGGIAAAEVWEYAGYSCASDECADEGADVVILPQTNGASYASDMADCYSIWVCLVDADGNSLTQYVKITGATSDVLYDGDTGEPIGVYPIQDYVAISRHSLANVPDNFFNDQCTYKASLVGEHVYVQDPNWLLDFPGVTVTLLPEELGRKASGGLAWPGGPYGDACYDSSNPDPADWCDFACLYDAINFGRSDNNPFALVGGTSIRWDITDFMGPRGVLLKDIGVPLNDRFLCAVKQAKAAGQDIYVALRMPDMHNNYVMTTFPAACFDAYGAAFSGLRWGQDPNYPRDPNATTYIKIEKCCVK
jgi:hypothetical protein